MGNSSGSNGRVGPRARCS